MQKLTENLSLKLLSLGIAFIIWTFITNTINPMVSGFVSVPVSIENESYILNQNKTYVVIDSRIIKVTYMVKSDSQTMIRQNDFKVYVDLKDLESTNSLPIHVTTLNDKEDYISNVLPEPQFLHVEIDDVSRNEFEVQYDLRGDVGLEHSVGSVILSPNVVYVSGSDVSVDNVDRVSIEIPLNDKEEMFSGVAKIRLFGKDGAPIPNAGYVFSAEDINYSVTINSRSSVKLNPVIEGTVQEGFLYENVVLNPSNVMLIGPKSIVQNMYVYDVPIDIEGLTGNTEITVNMSEILPKGIASSVDTIKATVHVGVDPSYINAETPIARIVPVEETADAYGRKGSIEELGPPPIEEATDSDIE